MTLFKRDPLKEMQDVARTDGALDQNHAAEFVIMTQGLTPGMYPGRSLEHALWQQESDTTKLDRWIAALEATEEELVGHLPRWQLVALLIVVLGIEFESGVLYWKDQGVTGITRIVMALATAGATIFLPWILIDLAKQWLSQGKEQQQ